MDNIEKLSDFEPIINKKRNETENRRYTLYVSDSLGDIHDNELDTDGGTYYTLNDAKEQAELLKSSMTYMNIHDGYNDLWSWSIDDDKDEKIKELTNELVAIKDINVYLKNKIQDLKRENNELKEIIITKN